MFLDDTAIIQLTRRKQCAAQRRVLVAMGIDHKVRPDGSLAVPEKCVDRAFGAVASAKQRKSTEPDWSAINAPPTLTTK